MVTRALPLYRPQRDLVRDCQAAGCDELLVRLEGLGLEEAVWVVRVDPGDDCAAAGLGDAEKALRGVGAVGAQTQQIELQRDVQLLRGQTQPLHFLAVERFRAGKVDQVRMGQIGIEAGLQGLNTLVYISCEDLGIVRRLVDIDPVDLVTDIVLPEQQIVDRILRDAGKQIVKKSGIILRLVADQDLNAPRIFLLQRKKRLNIVLQILREHVKIGDNAVWKLIRRVLGKAERLIAARDRGLDIFPFRAGGMMVAERVGVIIVKHTAPRI